MMNILKKKSKKIPLGIELTKWLQKKGTKCYFCPNIIHLHNEVGGVLWVTSGKPICAVCRVMRKNPMAKKIQADAKKAFEEKETNKVDDVALNSQLLAQADSDKKKKMLLNKK